ncbi:MAG: pentapeptide repeat-containing protein [Candidatus Coatesbacteria bacterium]|nr:pentapeptide repeat-containing protein [Candidatus Coatesbacteria bacterium]
MPDSEFCEVCETTIENAAERRAPLFGWGQDDCPLKKPLCWEHWNPDDKQIQKYRQFVELNRTDLSSKHLEGANLSLCNLKDAGLVDAHLEAACLKDANLEAACLRGAHLERADLSHAHLEGAKAGYIHLERAILWHANLNGAALGSSYLQGTCLTGAEIGQADVSFAELEDYTMWNVLFHQDRVTVCGGIRGIDELKGDPLTIRQIKDLAYAQSFHEKHRWFWGPLWKYSCGYGHSFGLWLMWCALFIVLFAWIYHDNGYLNYANDKPLEGFLQSLYFSVVSFTTLGFGDIVAKPGWGQFWAAVEVILGYLALGGLISILATKIARRS